MITRINESKTITKHFMKFIFDGRKYKLNQKWIKELCRYKCKNLIKHPILFKSKVDLES